MDKLDEVMIQSQAMSRLGTESKILVAVVSETMKKVVKRQDEIQLEI